VLSFGPVSAQEVHTGGEGEARHAFANELALFLGNTNLDGEDGFTIGLDYARTLSERVALGVFLDWAIGDNGRAFVVGVPLSFSPGIGELALTVGAGLERETPRSDAVEPLDSAETAHEAETLFMGRLGAQYPVVFGPEGRFFLAPQANLDVTHKHTATVLGATIGVEF
jgi:hypothetical protein